MKGKFIFWASLVTIGVAASYWTWSNQRSQELSSQLCRDVVHALAELHGSRASASAASSNRFEFAYGFRQQVDNAKEIAARWEADRSPDRRAIVDALLGALRYFDEAATILVELNTRPDEQKLGLFKVKLEEGRTRLIDTSAVVGMRGSMLNKKNKSDLIACVDSVFAKEVGRLRSSEEERRTPKLARGDLGRGIH